MGIVRPTTFDADEIGVNQLLCTDVASVLISAGDVPRMIWPGLFADISVFRACLAEDLFDARPHNHGLD